MTMPRLSSSLLGDARLSVTLSVDGPLPADALRVMPYAMTFGLNRTAEEALLAAHKVAKLNLHIRRPEFLREVFKLRARANVAQVKNGTAVVRFGLRASDFRGRAAVFVDHERGGTRMGSGSRSGFVYIPTYGHDLRRSVRDSLPRRWYPKALGLADRRAIDGSIIAGADRMRRRRGSVRGRRAGIKAFVIRDKRTREPIGIYRRVGPRRMSGTRDTNLQALFVTVRSMTVRPRLRFLVTSQRTAIDRLETNVMGMFASLMDRERGRSARAGELITLASLPEGARIRADGIVLPRPPRSR